MLRNRLVTFMALSILSLPNHAAAQRADAARSVGRIGAGGSDLRIVPRTVSEGDRAEAKRLEQLLSAQYPKVTANRILGRRSLGRTVEQTLSDLGVVGLDAEAAIAGARQERLRLFAAQSVTEEVNEPLPDAPGDYELAYAFTSNVNPGIGEATKERAPGYVWYAVSKWFSFEIDDDTALSIRSGSTKRTTGTGDVVLNANPVFWQEGHRQPKFLATYALKLPTASAANGLGSGYVDHIVYAEVQKHLGTSLNHGIVIDVGESWSGNGNGYDAGANVTLKYRFKTAKQVIKSMKIGVDTELDWNGPTGSDYAESHALIGPRFIWNDSVALRFGTRLGITDNTPRIGVYVGLVLDGNVDGQGVFAAARGRYQQFARAH